MVKLLNCDCMDFMRTLPDKAFDLAIIDPEYRDENQPDIYMRKSGGMKQWSGAPKGDFFKELKRISINQMVFGGNYFTEFLEPNNNWIVWYKNNDGTHLSMAELVWSSIRKNIKVFELRPMGLTASFHPTSKPIAIYKWILNKYAVKGNKILDTHGGSFSHAIAAYDLGFDLTIMEIDKDYFDAGKARFDAHVAKYSPASEIPVTSKGELKLF